jgi:hypothetical protein
MPESDGFGPKEAIWREFSARYLLTALAWPDEKLFRFSQHQKFENLTPEDQARVRQRLQSKIAWSTAAPPPHPPAVKPKLVPTALGPNTESSARCLAIALSWSDEKLLGFTRHRKFENLTPEDKAQVRRRLQAKIAQPTEAPPPHRPAITPNRELRVAVGKATMLWVTAITVGAIVLKLIAGG